MDKLRQIVADISTAMAHAGRHSSQDGDSSTESHSCEYDNVTPLSTSSSQLDAPDVSETSANGGRFVSNTSVTLSSAALPPAAAGAPPSTRSTMRKMQDSHDYVSYTSPKDLPVCRPAAAVPQRQPAPAADVEKEWRQIVHVAETVVESGPSFDELSYTSLDHLPVGGDSADTDRRRMAVFIVGDERSNGLPSPQPLSFANPLFLYRTSSRPSAVGSATSLDGSVIQKSYSLTSVNESGDIGSQSTAVGRATTSANRSHSPGRLAPSRQKIGTGLKGGKPSQSNECLTDGVGGGLAREHPEMRHSAVLSASESSPKLLGVGGNLSRSSELAVNCSMEETKHSSAVVGLDTPPDSPRNVGGHQKLPGNRKVTPSQNSVRMGVRSMQRRPAEQEKSKIEASVMLV